MLTVVDAKNGRVVCEEIIHAPTGKETRAARFPVSDLPVADRLARMGPDNEPGVALAKGLIMLDAQSHQKAREHFSALKKLRALSCAESDMEKAPRKETSPLTDVSALAGLPIESLSLAKTSVSDLGALRGMRLREVDLRQTPVRDLSPLAGMPLVSLDIRGTRVESLDSLRGMKLRMLAIGESAIDDISPLVGMPLERLEAAATKIRDISPLAGMSLRAVNIGGTRARDLSVLRGTPLDQLYASETKVEDLSPLQGAPLRYLDIRSSRVKNLAVIAQLPLVYPDCREVDAEDFHPLEKSPVQVLWLDDPEGPVKRVLGAMQNLREVNGAAWMRKQGGITSKFRGRPGRILRTCCLPRCS
ncbi:MAG: hypothetical protein QME60_03510 [Verrucomicrobiota bacterium]|nr:hypothetical protein [Verrucomicrobiota bacterium]